MPGKKAFQALFLFALAVVVLPALWGCKAPREPLSHQILTYTFDNDTRELINILGNERGLPGYRDFHQNFKGLVIPQSLLLRFEPFVLALSTRSKIPVVLLLDAPWVQRYGKAGWLYELETARVASREEFVPAVAEAFSVELPEKSRQREKKQLVATPPYIKGNVLFYRRDLLHRYGVKPPRTWEELKAACARILPREPSLKYGLLIHVLNFMNDFYPILWGYGAEVVDSHGRLVLGEGKNRALCLQALKDLQAMQGSILPTPADMRNFARERSLRLSYYQGEALFMINWNTRTHDLRRLIALRREPGSKCLSDFSQVGVAPIPCREGHPHRYSNIGSFGWGVNRFSITPDRLWVVDLIRQFIQLVTEEEFQLLNAEMYDHIPSLKRALAKVSKPEVKMVSREVFEAEDMVLKARPYSRRVNAALEKHLVEVLLSGRPAEEALDAALREVQQSGQVE